MARLSKEDLESAMFTPTGEVEASDLEVGRTVVAYSKGMEEVDENSPVAYAKRVNNEGKIIYYVKQDKYGNLYNPNGLYSERTENRNTRHAAGQQWKFRETDKKTFDYYVKFLKTKNEAWLNNAERGLA